MVLLWIMVKAKTLRSDRGSGPSPWIPHTGRVRRFLGVRPNVYRLNKLLNNFDVFPFLHLLTLKRVDKLLCFFS